VTAAFVCRIGLETFVVILEFSASLWVPSWNGKVHYVFACTLGDALSKGRVQTAMRGLRPKAKAKSRGRPRGAVDGIQREIDKYQQSTGNLIPKARFVRVVRGMMEDLGKPDLKFAANALEALQRAAEEHVVDFLSNSNKLAIHRSRVTVSKDDADLANYLRSGAAPQPATRPRR
jgi:histone H3/H4